MVRWSILSRTLITGTVAARRRITIRCSRTIFAAGLRCVRGCLIGIPRALPDRLFDALFAVGGCDRARALLAFYVSTGARASELLGVTVDLVDPGTPRIAVAQRSQ